jgi:hypothetical protein
MAEEDRIFVFITSELEGHFTVKKIFKVKPRFAHLNIRDGFELFSFTRQIEKRRQTSGGAWWPQALATRNET